jgi:hypothetical protein
VVLQEDRRQEVKPQNPETTSPHFLEGRGHLVEPPTVIPRSLDRAIAGPGRSDEKSIETSVPVPVVGSEEDVLVPARAGRGAVALVPGEEPRNTSPRIARKRHECPPDRLKKERSIGGGNLGPLRQPEDHDVPPDVGDRRHETQAEIAAVADDERPPHGLSKRDLDMV